MSSFLICNNIKDILKISIPDLIVNVEKCKDDTRLCCTYYCPCGEVSLLTYVILNNNFHKHDADVNCFEITNTLRDHVISEGFIPNF